MAGQTLCKLASKRWVFKVLKACEP